MNRTSLIAAVFIVANCIAVQTIPIFGTGPPPPLASMINFQGWPCVSVSSAVHSDAAGTVRIQRHWHGEGLATNLILSALLGFLGFAGLAWFLLPRFPRWTLLDLVALILAIAIVLAYSILTPRIGQPITRLRDHTTTHEVYTTDRSLLGNSLCFLLIGLATHGASSLALANPARISPPNS